MTNDKSRSEKHNSYLLKHLSISLIVLTQSFSHEDFERYSEITKITAVFGYDDVSYQDEKRKAVLFNLISFVVSLQAAYIETMGSSLGKEIHLGNTSLRIKELISERIFLLWRRVTGVDELWNIYLAEDTVDPNVTYDLYIATIPLNDTHSIELINTEVNIWVC